MKNDIIITDKLSEKQRYEAAQILYGAFGKKLRAYILKGDPKKGENCVRECINADCGLYALKDDSVMGFIGLDYNGLKFIDYKFSVFRRNYGLWGALWRTVINRIFATFFEHSAKNTVHIGKIAVRDDARGAGYGTMLLEASFKKAKELGVTKLTLEVIDTNPRALKLYQKIGFKVDKTQNFGRMTASAGFTEIYCMSKQIDC